RMGQHSLDGVAYRIAGADGLGLGYGQCAMSARMGGVVEVAHGFALFARQGDLVRVDDDDMIAEVLIGSPASLVFTHEDGGGLAGKAAQNHVIRVDNEPFGRNGRGIYRNRFHSSPTDGKKLDSLN